MYMYKPMYVKHEKSTKPNKNDVRNAGNLF